MRMWISATLMLLWQAGTAHPGPLEDCEQAQDIGRRIQGCSDRIFQYPRDATAFFNRATAYLGKGDFDRAIADYTRVIQIDPAYSVTYYYRGIAYENKERYDLAIADFTKTVELNPSHAGAFNARARVYLKTDERVLALRDAERAVSLDPTDEKFLETRARLYEALGRPQDAIVDNRRVLSSNPSTKSAIDGLKRLSSPSAALNVPADPVRKVKRIAKPAQAPPVHHAPPTHQAPPVYHSAVQPRFSQEEIECEQARHADPVGQYADYPCWAREALSRRLRR
jgi:tetratricopeptide (TPR) repeat protein